jgi:hypothetical protein
VERLLNWYRVGSSAGAVAALIGANLVPLIGVLWFGWSMWTILTIYWVENGVVGLFNVLKMAAVAGIGKLGVIPFFVVHYGMFWFVHGIFVLTLPSFVPFSGAGVSAVELQGAPGAVAYDVRILDTTTAGADFGNVAIAAVVLFISHGLSYVFNFIGRGEFRRTTAMALMSAPYRRVVILHLTIIFGAFAVVMLGAQVLPLVILVALKTAVDLAFHLREHRAAEGPAPMPAGTTPG